MVDLFDIPVYYISFKHEPELVRSLYGRGFRHVRFFKAIDGRQFSVDELMAKNIISIRSYRDLVTVRDQHQGLPSLGAVGCTMSHCALWKKCVDMNMPYMVIVEPDVIVPQIKPSVKTCIETAVTNKPRSVFVGVRVRHNGRLKEFTGLQFYVVSREACVEMVQHAFPIDVQTDWYLAHLASTDRINLEGFQFARQKLHKSSIQDVCIKCVLPPGKIFYTLTAVALVLVGVYVLYRLSQSNACKAQLAQCKTTCGIAPTTEIIPPRASTPAQSATTGQGQAMATLSPRLLVA